MRTLRLWIATLALAGLALGAAAARASDAAKERRWADQIVDGLVVGDAEWLKAGGREFLAIYAEQTGREAKGAVILLHGIGVHPDWPDVIHPLRVELPEHGWSTLSLQMPVLPNDAGIKDYPPLFDEVPARIDAGVAFLRARGIRNIVLVGHSLGALMGAYYLSRGGAPAIRAFVAIGIGGYGKDPRTDTPALLEKIRIPVLDLFGGRDLEHVRRTAKARTAAARRADNRGYRQVVVEGADHFFRGLEDDLVKRVWGWLERSAPGTEIPAS